MRSLLLLLTVLLLHLTAISQTVIVPCRISLVVKNMDSASAWYGEHFGMTTYKKLEFPEYDGLKIHFLKQPGFEIEMIEKKTSFSIDDLVPDYSVNKNPLRGFYKIAFRVKDLQGLFERMSRNGVRVVIPVTHDSEFREDWFIIEDPDGNTIQILSGG